MASHAEVYAAMPSFDVVNFLNLLFVGLLAGFEIAVHYGIGSPIESLREDAQILLRQAMVLRLRILAPALFLPSLILGIAATVRERHEPGLWQRGVGLGALILWIIIRAVRTVPVNSATLAWNPKAPPENWRELVEGTERFHIVAAWAAVIAFICFLASALQYR
jgi:hypothetical protein